MRRRLKKGGPLVLVAGQQIDTAHEGVLHALLQHVGNEPGEQGWSAALKSGVDRSAYSWLSERFDRTVISEDAAVIYNVAWSAVFTSSVDPRFGGRFETRGRQPERVLSKDVFPRAPRSRSRPPIYHLLGKSDETVEDAAPPTSTLALKRRLSMHATPLLNRIAETATVRGVVVIAGVDPTGDWLPIDLILAPMFGASGPKVLWFGVESVLGSEFAEEMAAEHTLLTTSSSLAGALADLELRGLLDASNSAAPDDPGIVSIGDTALPITANLRLRVEASVAIVDDEWTEQPVELDKDESYSAFRRFHGSDGNFRALVSGVARGFAMEREFEAPLWRAVTRQLTRLGQTEVTDVVFLHGQSGTGKSIALARLTLRLREELRIPVLVATYRMPTHADIEAFCFEAEQAGADATVLVCDSNQAPRRYEDLASALRSRGRRLLIVVTSYRLEGHPAHERRHFVEAPNRVSGGEWSAFQRWGERAGIPQMRNDESTRTTDSVFAMLYRRLPAARERLAAGVSREARTVEGTVRVRARTMPRPSREMSEIARQLVDLGVASRNTTLFEDEDTSAGELDPAAKLVDYVMVAGRLGSAVPVNLLFRAVGGSTNLGLDQLFYLFEDLDLFRWEVDSAGTDYSISPRLQLEADLICRRPFNPHTGSRAACRVDRAYSRRR